MNEKPTAWLFGLSGIGLIISYPTGVLVGNQAGGYACAHPRLEGLYLPLIMADSALLASLDRHFRTGKWAGRCDSGIDAETADFMDHLFGQDGYSKGLKVDRDKLASCLEAWIHVTFDETAFAPGVGAILKPPTHGSGVVTWPNSD